MSNKFAFLAVAVVFVYLALVQQQALAQDESCPCKDVLSPSQVADMFWAELFQDPAGDNQVKIVSKYLALTKFDTDNMPDSRIDRLALGEGAFLTFQVDLADKHFESVLEGDDLIASHAWDRMMQVQFRALENVERARGMVEEFYEKFPPSVFNTRGRWQQIGNFMSYHRNADEPEKAIDYLIEELEAMPQDSPHNSYSLLGGHAELIENSPRQDEIRSIVSEKLSALRKLQRKWAKEKYLASDDPILRGDMPAWYWRSQGVRSGESLRAARSRQLDGLVGFLERWLDGQV